MVNMMVVKESFNPNWFDFLTYYKVHTLNKQRSITIIYSFYDFNFLPYYTSNENLIK